MNLRKVIKKREGKYIKRDRKGSPKFEESRGICEVVSRVCRYSQPAARTSDGRLSIDGRLARGVLVGASFDGLRERDRLCEGSFGSVDRRRRSSLEPQAVQKSSGQHY